jgi:hypothetical protein
MPVIGELASVDHHLQITIIIVNISKIGVEVRTQIRQVARAKVQTKDESEKMEDDPVEKLHAETHCR